MATLVSIVSTLALLVIMAAEMGHTQTLNCGGISPIAGPWSNVGGTCYIQQTYSPSGPSPLKCASTTVQPTTSFFGQSTLTFTIKANNATQTQTGTWIQINQFLNILLGITNLCTQPAEQVIAIGLPTNQTSVNSVVFQNAIGYIMTSCPVADGSNVLAMTKAIICTNQQTVKAADLKTLTAAATKLGLTNMVTVDQTNC